MGVKSTKSKSGGGRKIGRQKRKALAKSNAISKFVRNVISAEEYFKISGLKSR